MSPIESILSLFPSPSIEHRQTSVPRGLEIRGRVLPDIQQDCPIAKKIALQEKNNGLAMRLGNWSAKKLGFEVSQSLPNPDECLGKQIVKGSVFCCTEVGDEQIKRLVDREGVQANI